jgi:hypothetical protein
VLAAAAHVMGSDPMRARMIRQKPVWLIARRSHRHARKPNRHDATDSNDAPHHKVLCRGTGDKSTGADLPITVPVKLSGAPMRLSRRRSRYCIRKVRQLLRLQARTSRRPIQLSYSMNYRPFNNSCNVLARGQAKPGHLVLGSGKRHPGATNLPHAVGHT